MDFERCFDQYLDKNRLDRADGDKGVENLEKLALALGYTPNGFRFGDSISRFLSDNPGAIEAIHKWIRETALPEWAEMLEFEEEEEDEE